MAGVSAHGGVEATANPKPGSAGYLKWYWLDQRPRPRQMGRLHHPPRTPRQIHGTSHGRPRIRSLVPRSQRLLARSRPQPSSPRQTTQRQDSRTRL